MEWTHAWTLYRDCQNERNQMILNKMMMMMMMMIMVIFEVMVKKILSTYCGL
jgi:hypothetical protein